MEIWNSDRYRLFICVWMLCICAGVCGAEVSKGDYPLVYPDVFKQDKQTLLHFKWRADMTNYQHAVIKTGEGNVVAQLDRPANLWEMGNIVDEKLYLYALDEKGNESETVEFDMSVDHSSHYGPKPERIVIDKKTGRFTYAGTDREFIAKGVNFCGITLGDHDTFEPPIEGLPVCYDPYHVESVLRTIKKYDYNLVRVFIKTGGRDRRMKGMSGPADTKGLYAPYMENVVDFLRKCSKYGIYVMPCFTENEMMDNDYFRKLSGGASGQGVLFSAEAIRAKQLYIRLFLEYIRAKDPALLDTLFAVTMQNEFAFYCNVPPFSQTNGVYTFLDGRKYDMTDDTERRALANAAIRNYYTAMKQAVSEVLPELPVGEGTFALGAVGKTYENSKGIRRVPGVDDSRYPMTALELLRTDIDFLDFHVYRWGHPGDGAEVFRYFTENMGLRTEEADRLRKSKPVIMGEFGTFKENEATLDAGIRFAKELKKAALDFGFKGTCFWTIDTFEQERIWNLMYENGRMLREVNAE
ncbi:MAG: hypothetical protein IJU47_02115 [Verrucomicrobia bacterium]|nr:hypothetical protein [Verrucomicrobiota bacterium]